MLNRFYLILFLLTVSFYCQQEPGNRYLLAQAFEKNGEYDKAEKLYQELLKEQNWNTQYFTALNNLLLRQKKFTESIKLIEERMLLFPGDITLPGELGVTYHQKGDLRKAYEIWDAELNKPGAAVITARVLANYAIRVRALDKAILILENNLQKTTNEQEQRITKEQLANLYLLTMNFGKAVIAYCEIIKTQVQYYQVLINAFREVYATDQTAGIFISITEEYYDKTRLEIYLTILREFYTIIGDFNKAAEVMIKQTDSTRNFSELLSYSENLLAAGEFDAVIKISDYITEVIPDSSQAVKAQLNNLIARQGILEEQGNAKDAAKLIKDNKLFLEKKADKNSEAGVLYNLSYLYLKYNNDKSAAEKYADEVLKKYPTSVYAVKAGFIKCGILKNDYNNLEEVKNILTGLINNPYASGELKSEISYRLASVYLWLNKWGIAKNTFNEVSANYKSDLANNAVESELLIVLCNNDSLNFASYCNMDYFIETDRIKQADSIFHYIKSGGANDFLKSYSAVKYAEKLIILKDYNKALELLNPVAGEEKISPFFDKTLYLQGKIFQYGLKNTDKAAEIYNKFLSLYTDSIYLDEVRSELNLLTTSGKK